MRPTNLFAILFPLIALSCSRQSDEVIHSFKVYEEDGVVVAENSGGPKFKGQLFEFDQICTIQEDNQKPESMLYRPDEGLMDDPGNIYIADEGNARIAVFGKFGQYSFSIGAKGFGPGEFQALRLLAAYHDTLVVYDYRQKRTSLFHTDGLFIKSYSSYQGGRFLLSLHPLPDNGKVLLERQIIREQGIDIYTYFAVTLSASGDTTGVVSTVSYPYGRQFRSGAGIGWGLTFFGPRSYILFNRNHGILSSYSGEPILKWYSLNGDFKKIIKLNFIPELVTNDDRNNIQKWLGYRINEEEHEQGKQFWRDFGKNSVIPVLKSHWAGIEVDDAGFHWLMQHFDFKDSDINMNSCSYKVLSPEGEYLGDVDWPALIASISKGHLITREEDQSTGKVAYTVYRIRPIVEGLQYP